MQYLLTFVLIWAVIGNIAAMLLSSAGPVYFGRVTGLPDPYAPLMEYLHQASAMAPVPALHVQDMLWMRHGHVKEGEAPFVTDEDDVAPFAPVSACRPAERDELLPPERDAPVAPRAGDDLDLARVDELHCRASSTGRCATPSWACSLVADDVLLPEVPRGRRRSGGGPRGREAAVLDVDVGPDLARTGYLDAVDVRRDGQPVRSGR